MAADAESVHYPCPACGSPLFGWTAAHDPLRRGERIVLDRCEACGLAVTRADEPPDPEGELEALIIGDGDGFELISANRRSIQGGLGGAQWAGLEPELGRLHLNPESTRLLLAKQGLDVESVRTPYRPRGNELMRQTMINAFTLRDNFLRNARAGRLPEPTGTKDRLLLWLDYAVSYIVWVPCAVVAYPLERIAAASGRGGVMEVRAVRRVS